MSDPRYAVAESVAEFVRVEDPAESSSGTVERVAQWLAEFAVEGLPLRLLIPAFPGKSANPQSVFGAGPDAAEVHAVAELDRLTHTAARAWRWGVELTVLQDGDFYPGLPLLRGRDAIAEYGESVRRMSTNHSVRWESLQGIFDSAGVDDSYRAFEEQYCEALEVVSQLSQVDAEMRQNVSRFSEFLADELPSDTSPDPDLEFAALAYLRNNRGVWRMIDQRFGDAGVLSLHRQRGGSRKLGINAINGNSDAKVPWFQALLEFRDGTAQHIKCSRGRSLGYPIVHDRGGTRFVESPDAVNG